MPWLFACERQGAAIEVAEDLFDSIRIIVFQEDQILFAPLNTLGQHVRPPAAESVNCDLQRTGCLRHRAC